MSIAFSEAPPVTMRPARPLRGPWGHDVRPVVVLVPVAAKLLHDGGVRRAVVAGAAIAGGYALLTLGCRAVAHGLDCDVEVDPALER